MSSIPTFVLDTNAWLDLLVFGDPAFAGFVERVRSRQARIAIDDRALGELARVLRYDALRLDNETIAQRLQTARDLATPVQVPAMRLPRCRDPDDQMFLEIAVAAHANALLTRDAELLRMARRMQRDYGFAIVAPTAWRDVVGQMSKR
ncbi:putative toxin-antitoxin system toxin component, PIN family [Cognatilysobacter terrigena]|uniref:putative toxin-antitoxin system toxin component, PIN family n=1 Tax=Cognatilysobacter terrigena TaxID=2488749 RepID=UPI00105E81F2|nr:putative toxin-antitoxin system toxin component, PIN family [Lysobacter terrigena]